MPGGVLCILLIIKKQSRDTSIGCRNPETLPPVCRGEPACRKKHAARSRSYRSHDGARVDDLPVCRKADLAEADPLRSGDSTRPICMFRPMRRLRCWRSSRCLAEKFGASWMDPVMGLVGAVPVSVWASSLLRNTSRVLLDAEM